jgi:hypothetical protein
MPQKLPIYSCQTSRDMNPTTVILCWGTVDILCEVRSELYQCYASQCIHISPHQKCLCLIFLLYNLWTHISCQPHC